MDDDFNSGDITVSFHGAERINRNRTIFQFDAFEQTTADTRLNFAVNTRDIGLRNLVGGVGQSVRKLTIIRQ